MPTSLPTTEQIRKTLDFKGHGGIINVPLDRALTNPDSTQANQLKLVEDKLVYFTDNKLQTVVTLEDISVLDAGEF